MVIWKYKDKDHFPELLALNYAEQLQRTDMATHMVRKYKDKDHFPELLALNYAEQLKRIGYLRILNEVGGKLRFLHMSGSYQFPLYIVDTMIVLPLPLCVFDWI